MTDKYTNVKVNISDEQKAKIKNVLHSEADSISFRLKPEDFAGDDVLALTQRQINKLTKASEPK